jgi:hypothetical protein
MEDRRSRLSRQTGVSPVVAASDRLSSGSAKKLKKIKKSLTISRKTITTGARQILNLKPIRIL